MTSGVYAIRNQVTGRAYIGGTANTTTRWSMHRIELNRGDHRNAELQADWTAFGSAAFSFEILEEISNDRRHLKEVEERSIRRLGGLAYNQRKALDERALTMRLTEDDQRYIQVIRDYYRIAKPGGAIRTAVRQLAAHITRRLAEDTLSRLERAAVVSSERVG